MFPPSICQTLGLTEFDVSDQEAYRIDKALQTIDFSETVVRSSFEDQFSPRKMSAIFDLPEILAKSPPISPNTFTVSDSPPPSPGIDKVPASLGSPRSVSLTSADGRHDSDTDSSETEISDSDVFSEHSEVSVHT